MTAAASPPQSDPVRQKAAPRRAPMALWRIAETFLALLYNLFGEPQDVAARDTLTRKTHALLASWLRAGEALMRRLLLIEASFVPRPNTPAARPGGKHVRRMMYFTADNPDAWRVCLRFSAANTGASAAFDKLRQAQSNNSASLSLSKGARAKKERRFLSAWPLAERYEALLRIFNDPTAAARRLARRLFAKPQGAAAILRTHPEDEQRIGEHRDLSAALETANALFNTS